LFPVLLIFAIMGLLVAVIFLSPKWVEKRRQQVARRPLPPQWRAILEQRVAPYGELTPHQRQRLHGQMQVLLAEKQFLGCNGLQVTEDMWVTVAAMASLLLLHEHGYYFPKLKTILLYPSAYWVTETVSTDRFIHQERRVSRLGESWSRDQLVLAWDQVEYDSRHWRDGRNVVLHEFAHQLDQAEGSANGVPRLPKDIDSDQWSRVMTAAYNDLTEAVEKNRRTRLNRYGATNPAEFFSVATETFFEQPKKLKLHNQQLFDLLRRYYQINPSLWKL
jgi:Mlc titration factor MtfA (ptsG expression regulator)